MKSKYVLLLGLFFSGCAPGFIPGIPPMSPDLGFVILLSVIIFGLYLYKKQDEKDKEDVSMNEILERLKKLEEDIKELKEKRG